MKVGGQRGVWVELWPNRGRRGDYPALDADVVIAINLFTRSRMAALRPWPVTANVGGSGIMRRWLGFVPESALAEFEAVLKQHGITLEVEES